MSEQAVISARGLGKCYRVWTHSKPTSLSDRVETLAATLRHRARRAQPPPLREEIWALRNVSFDVRRGEVLGVIGPNGAGKSTLLSILARITEPTEGYAEIRGRVSSLLEVGTGFHPELSGRDNIYLNGAILGMSRRETEEKYEQIIDFSGVREFIDMPVKRYSSGMHVRLAFAVAAHLDPEVLLLDEVLAVGDSAFQEKCLRRIDELTQSGRTVLFVSHTMAAVSQLCHRAIVINGGSIVFEGGVEQALEHYLDSPQLDGGPSANTQTAQRRDGSGAVRVTEVRVLGSGRPGTVSPDGPVTFEVDLAGASPLAGRELHVDVGIWSSTTGQPVTLSTRYEADESFRAGVLGTSATLVCELDELPLRPGTYTVAIGVEEMGELLDACRHQTEFRIVESDYYGSGVIPREDHASPVLVRQRWRAANVQRVAAS